jgi:hypothetical protein
LKTLIKYTLLIIFVFTTLLYNIRFSYFLYQYHFNNKVFIENYCVNKDKPSLKCNGKCELVKIAKEGHKQEQPNKKISDLEILFFMHDKTLFAINKNILIFQPILTSCNKHNFDCLIYLDRPPKINFQILI